jgi:hypothetical protein
MHEVMRSTELIPQQYTLALNISENVLFLQRPYYVRALHERPLDPTLSIYGESYLAVVERCSVSHEGDQVLQRR